MKPTPRLILELRPSRRAVVIVGIGAAATGALILALPLSWWVATVALAAIGAHAAFAIRRLRAAPAAIYVGIDRRITVVDRSGHTHDGRILDDSFVAASLTTIVWRSDSARPWQPARTLLIVPDMIAPDDFRRLRLVLRYGRRAEPEGSSEVDAA